MVDSSNDAGTIQVLLERLNNWRLPRVLAIKKRVDDGGLIGDFELQILKDALEDARGVEQLVGRHPEYQELAGRMVGLYDEITKKALENEQKT
jgi:hypothetical protein